MYEHQKQLFGTTNPDGTIEWVECIATPDKVIHVDMYKIDIGVFFSPEGADFYMHTVHGCDNNQFQDCFDSSTSAMAFVDESGGAINHIGVIFPTPPNGGLLAHECLHLVDYICDHVGIDMSLDTMEPRAYLLEYLYDNIEVAIAAWQEEHPEWPI